MARISERELVLPALLLIRENPGISTSQLIDQLTVLLRPAGEDAQILEGRSDTKFSQKVRNLVSHHTLDQEGPGYTEYVRDGANGYHRITPKGIEFLKGAEESLGYLIDAGFTYSMTGQALVEVADARQDSNVLEVVPDGLLVAEGQARQVSRQVLSRSRALRNAAVAHYSKGGRIACAACGFDFRGTYGAIGDGFIEMHHVTPLFQRRGQSLEEFIAQAILGLVPLCSNCHKMVHARRPEPLSVEQLSRIIQHNKTAPR